MVDEEPSINIPSLLTLAVVSFLVIRWFLNRDGSNGGANGAGRSRGRMIDPAQVEQIDVGGTGLGTKYLQLSIERRQPDRIARP